MLQDNYNASTHQANHGGPSRIGAENKALTFEQKLDRIQAIVAKLENGDASIEESVKMFEEGMQLSWECNKELDAAEQKIMKVSKGENGEPQVTPFGPKSQTGTTAP